MNNLDNFEPFDDLEDWSDNVDLFMDAMANPPQHADALWELATFKKKKSKAPEQSSKSIFDIPWIKEPEGCWRLPTSPSDDARRRQFGMAVFHEPRIDPQAHGIPL